MSQCTHALWIIIYHIALNKINKEAWWANATNADLIFQILMKDYIGEIQAG